MQRLPPLNAVKAFESVGRLQSFTRAAEELHVTTAAISRQVKVLEEFLGTLLLHRDHGHVAFTGAGRRYFRSVSDSFGSIVSATRHLRDSRSRRRLRISVPPTLATWWLLPRLEHLMAQRPEMDLQLVAETDLADFARDEADVAIRYGRLERPELLATPLAGNHVFPVCSPTIAADGFVRPADLRHARLISSASEKTYDPLNPGWRGWLRRAGVNAEEIDEPLNLAPLGLALQAAAQGMGYALGRSLVVADALRQGMLVCPFGPVLAVAGTYHFVYPERVCKDPDVIVVRDWLEAQALECEARVRERLPSAI
jgi:LysR family glycine cleavage system transcriptional activator